MIEARYEGSMDMKYYEEFVRKFKRFEDFPEIEAANSSEDFFVDNLSSGYFQWAAIHQSADKTIYINK